MDGRAELHTWLHAPVERIREVRLDLLLKLYFLHRSDPPAERELLARQIDVCEAYERRLAGETTGQRDFARLVAMSKLSAAQATLRWLRAYAAELEHREEEPSHAPASP